MHIKLDIFKKFILSLCRYLLNQQSKKTKGGESSCVFVAISACVVVWTDYRWCKVVGIQRISSAHFSFMLHLLKKQQPMGFLRVKLFGGTASGYLVLFWDQFFRQYHSLLFYSILQIVFSYLFLFIFFLLFLTHSPLITVVTITKLQQTLYFLHYLSNQTDLITLNNLTPKGFLSFFIEM